MSLRSEMNGAEIERLFHEHAKAFPFDQYRTNAEEWFWEHGFITQEQERQLRELAIPENKNMITEERIKELEHAKAVACADVGEACIRFERAWAEYSAAVKDRSDGTVAYEKACIALDCARQQMPIHELPPA